jgi:NAD(P)-dependent dehydrogenase (short-subunit alcohol dehydrogenase family)
MRRCSSMPTCATSTPCAPRSRGRGRARAGYRARQQCRAGRPPRDRAAVDEAYWEENLAINLRPHFFTIQAVAPGMKQAGRRRDRQFHLHLLHAQHRQHAGLHGGEGGHRRPDQGHGRRLGPDNIRVNAIAPGWVMTERQKELWVTEEGLAAMIERQCIKEPIQPEDMVGPCLFLASKRGAMVTAQV